MRIIRTTNSVVPVCLLLWATAWSSAADFHVSTRGRDNNPGTRDKPFASIERARDGVRALKKETGLPAGGVTVRIEGGDYAMSGPIEFSSEDSGTEKSPITYRGRDGEEVRIVGIQIGGNAVDFKCRFSDGKGNILVMGKLAINPKNEDRKVFFISNRRMGRHLVEQYEALRR